MLERTRAEAVIVPIVSDVDVVAARHQGRSMAQSIGFGNTEATLVATAISELARNIVLYAKRGRIELTQLDAVDTVGICIVASDNGPGIADADLAVRIGYSTSGGLGLGLPGVRRIMDEFELDSSPQCGTTVRAVRWKQR